MCSWVAARSCYSLATAWTVSLVWVKRCQLSRAHNVSTDFMPRKTRGRKKLAFFFLFFFSFFFTLLINDDGYIGANHILPEHSKIREIIRTGLTMIIICLGGGEEGEEGGRVLTATMKGFSSLSLFYLSFMTRPLLFVKKSETERGPERSCRINTQGI